MSNYYIPGGCDTYNPACGYGGVYNNRFFSDIFPEVDLFVQEYEDSGLAVESNRISVEYTKILYWLLMARFRNEVPEASDENRFKADVFATMFKYGPAWEARIKAQKSIRDLLESDELFDSSVAIFNTSLTPGSKLTDVFDPIKTVNQQNANKWRKNKLDGYAALMDVLKTDVTEQFLDKFDRLFREFMLPDSNLLYTTTPEEQALFDEEV